MKLKIIPTQKQLIAFMHILFWFISFNFWSFILNPGVESASIVEGFEVEYDFIYLVNFICLVFCSLPFVWLLKKASLWIKIPVTLIFIAQVAYFILVSFHPENNDIKEIFQDFFVKNFMYVIVFHLTILFAVYYNLKVLIVRFLNKGQFVKYLFYVTGLIVLSAIVNYSLYDMVIDKLVPGLYYISYFRIWELILIVAAYLVFTGILFLIWQYAQMLIVNRDAARNELSALKAQINPHFLFNNLNTIYSLATQKDERTSDVILKLSDFLRYILYDTSAETIQLEKEIEIIKTYIGLQKERINPETTTVEFETSGDFGKVEIAPLLLLPLVENCFKHGVGKDSGSIRIFVELRDRQLHFQTTNTIALREAGNETGGIGIKNVEKRLNLIYPNRHSLEFQEEEGAFRLELKVQLN